MTGKTTGQFSAGEQGLGYIYQARLALLQLLQLPEDTAIFLEKDDDLDFIDGDGGKSLASLNNGVRFILQDYKAPAPIINLSPFFEENFEETKKAVPLETLRRSPSPVMPKLGGYYQYSIVEISKTERKVMVQSRDSDVYVMDFIFRRNGCCWHLVRTEEMAY